MIEASPRHLVVCANPSPASFDHAIVAAYGEVVRAHGQAVTVRDLYALGFDPVLKLEERPRGAGWQPAPDVVTELAHLRRAGILVLVYPIWYGLPPAILKGYVDRVLGANYSFRDFHDAAGQPALKGKPLLSISTSGMPLEWLRQQGQSLSLKEIFDVYLWRGFGMRQSEHVMIESVVPHMAPDHAAAAMARVRAAAERACAVLADEPLARAPVEA